VKVRELNKKSYQDISIMAHPQVSHEGVYNGWCNWWFVQLFCFDCFNLCNGFCPCFFSKKTNKLTNFDFDLSDDLGEKKESKMGVPKGFWKHTLLQHPSSSHFLCSMIWFTPITCSLSAFVLIFSRNC
jgi:hypothetical protein